MINQQTTSAGENVEKGEPSCTVGGNVDWCNHCGKCLVNTHTHKMKLPYDLAFPLLRIYLKKPDILIQNNMCTPMFIGALHTIAKLLKQLKCPPVVHLYNGILHRSKKEGNLTFCDSMDEPREHYVK